MHIDELDTPVPVVDLDIVEHNLAKMQAYCDSHGLSWAPKESPARSSAKPR